MNHAELKAFRCFLLLDTDEAAKHIGGVSARTWQRWEKGDINIPNDVIEKANDLKDKRQKLLDMYIKKGIKELKIPYELQQSSPIEYKIFLSVICELSTKNQITILIA